jgi:hypothetical protein
MSKFKFGEDVRVLAERREGQRGEGTERDVSLGGEEMEGPSKGTWEGRRTNEDEGEGDAGCGDGGLERECHCLVLQLDLGAGDFELQSV